MNPLFVVPLWTKTKQTLEHLSIAVCAAAILAACHTHSTPSWETKAKRGKVWKVKGGLVNMTELSVRDPRAAAMRPYVKLL